MDIPFENDTTIITLYTLPFPMNNAAYKYDIYEIHFFVFIIYLMTLTVSQTIALNERMIANNELERLWKEVVVA
jgi:hypothetical protein